MLGLSRTDVGFHLIKQIVFLVRRYDVKRAINYELRRIVCDKDKVDLVRFKLSPLTSILHK